MYLFLLYKILCRGKGQHDSCKTFIQFLFRKFSPANCRVIDIWHISLKTFKYYKMIKIPMDDTGCLHFLQIRNLLAVSMALEPLLLCRTHNISRVTAIPGNTGLDAYLLKRHIFSIV